MAVNCRIKRIAQLLTVDIVEILKHGLQGRSAVACLQELHRGTTEYELAAVR